MEAGHETRDAGLAADKPPIRSYEDLDCYQRAMRLLTPVHALASSLPDHERFELASQLRRASKSIPANIAEGYGKKASERELKAYVNNALGSANEVIVHLKIAKQLAYASPDDIDRLVEEFTVVAKQLYRLRETWRNFGHDSGTARPASRLSPPASRTQGV